MKAIIVHGGAGRWKTSRKEKLLEGLKRSVETGYGILREGGSALDACCEALRVLEDNPLFNAGTGSTLTLEGECEMDALIMRGKTLEVGAVGAIKGVRNPILVARKVMEETDHVLLIGDGAIKFARAMGFETYNPVTNERKKEREKLLSKLKGGEGRWKKLRNLVERHPELISGTVGCVAIDDSGEIVSGNSTGGISLKLAGRLGDTPLPGAGAYATPYGGASATGVGEGIMRILLSKIVCDFMRIGLSAMKAAQAGIDLLTNEIGSEGGVIAIDSHGNLGYAYNTPFMPVSYIKDGMEEPFFDAFPQ